MRKCGSCHVCCVIPHQPEIDKKAGVRCPNLDTCGKCEIYDERPKLCRQYQCAWLEGAGKKADRPDKSGVLVEIRDTQFGKRRLIKSVRPKAVQTKTGRRAAYRLCGEEVGIEVNNDNGQVIALHGPQKAIDTFKMAYEIR